MAAEVSADLTLIQDEDVLRRMWAQTEDLGRKKEIRARMYRLREQRLRDFYTTGEVVTEITGRKHATTTHTESIGDQGFLTMKSKEIRDSESPTRDFSRRANNGYWQSVEERGYTTGNQDGTAIERSEESRRGEGVVVEGNAETRMAISAQNILEKTSKSDDNMSVKSETNQKSQKFASVTESDDKSSRKETSESQNSESYQEEKTSQSSTASTKISSTTSSSRKVISSSVTSKYEIVGGEKRLIDTDVKAITSGDDYTNLASNLRSEQANVHESNRQTSTVVQDEINNLRFQQPQEQIISDTQDINVTKSSSNQTSHDSKNYQSQQTNEAYNTVQNYTTNYSTVVENDGTDTYVIENKNRYKPEVDSRTDIVETVLKDSSTKHEQNIQRTKNVRREEEISQTQKQNEISEFNEYIKNEKIDSSTFDRKKPKAVTETPSLNEKVIEYTSVKEVSNDSRDSSINQTQLHSNTDQKIMNEINKLDTYLQHQNTPAPSEPATPRTVTDGAQWTVVSNRDERGEFVYQNDNTPRASTPQPPHSTPTQTTREQPIKHPSSLDLPKDATDGQYVTTYQQSYNRISVDNSPSHEFFVRTLRASPDRLTPSPTKSSRGSLDRNSPDRKLRATSKGSLDRSSPESCKRRSFSKGSLDRSTPDRTFRPSPSKTPERERRGSSESYTIDRKKDVRRKTTEITQQMVRDTTNKTRRKFSSTQQKAANKTRVSTPGVSPSTSPTRTATKKEVTSGSESDISQATYNKASSISSFRDENLTTINTEKNKHVTEQSLDNQTNILKKSVPREKSPEYSSEGSVSREINKSITSRSEITTKENSFKPIKQSANEDTNENFTLEEQKKFVSENETTESYDKRKLVSTANVIQKDTVEINEVTDYDADTQNISKPEDSVDNQCKLIKNQIITEKNLVEELRVVKDRSSPDRNSPTSSPERRPKETKKPEAKEAHRKSHPENVSKPKTSLSPERKQTERQPLRQLNQKRPSDSSSPSTKERNPKTSFQHKPTDKRPNRPSPDRRQPSATSPEREIRKKPLDENRRSVSSSPERRAPMSTAKTNQITSSTFISKETKTETRERSLSSSPERNPLKQTPNRTTDKSPLSRQQKPSPSTSPERNISPDRKTKLTPTKKENTPTNNQQTPTVPNTNQRVVQKATTKESVRTTRYSSIPRANKLSPRNSKDKIEPPNNKAPSQIIRKATPIPRSVPTTRLTSSITRTNKITEQKQETVKSSQVKLTNGSRKPIETTPKRAPSKIATPKSTPTKPRAPEASANKPSTHRIPRLNDSPHKTTVNKRTTQTPINKKVTKSNNEIEITEVTQTIKKTSENEDFLKRERSILDLEDENPPEEFYAEYDDRTDDTSPERLTKSIRTVDDVSVNVNKTVKTSIQGTKQVSPSAKSSVKPTPKVSTPKKEIKLTETTSTINKAEKMRENNKTKKTSRKIKTQRKNSKDYDSSSSSSSSEEEEIEQNQNENLTENNQVTHESIQDLLTVVVQHPKSSRESSPGYPSANQPFCTTSEDGDSNPRYADYITEPDDGEVFDNHRGPGTPIRLTEDETIDVKSVADRVNVFLEATRVTQETVHQVEPVVSSPKSVLKAKTMFENIAKNQVSGSQQPDKAPKSPNCNITQNHYIDDDYKTSSNKQTRHDDRDVSKSFIEKEIITQYEINEVDDENLLNQSKVQDRRTSSSNGPEEHSTVSVDVTSKKNYFERRQHEEFEIHDEIDTAPKEISPKRVINERKSPSPLRESPKTGSNVAPVTKKAPEQNISTTVGTKKKIFENTTEENESRETEITPYHPEERTPKRSPNKQKSPSPQRQVPKTPEKKNSTTYSARKQSFEKTTESIEINETLKGPYEPEDSTPKRSVSKQKSPSPQRQSPKTNTAPDNKKPVEKKSSTIVGAKKRLFENTTEEIEIRKTVGHVPKDDTSRPYVAKQKSPSPQRQPSKPLNITPDSKKSVEKKSSIVDTRKQSFEKTTEVIDIVEQKNIKNIVDDNSVRKQTSQTDITKRRPSLKEKSPIPQINTTKPKETTDSKKPFERKKSGPVVDVSSKKDFFEKKVKDISIAASKVKPQISKISSPSRSNPDSSGPRLEKTDQTFSESRVRSLSPDKSDVYRHTDVEEVISETTRKVSLSQDTKQTFSKTEEITKKNSESDQSEKLIKSEISHQMPSVTSQPAKKPSKVENVERKSTKTEEIIRKSSKPEEIIHTPTKSETKLYSDRTYNKNESSIRSTTNTSTRGQTPERQPEEIIRKISKPEEITRKPSKPEEITRKFSNTEEITRKTSRPSEIVRKPSKPDDVNEKTSKPEEIVRRPSSRTESYAKSTTISTVKSRTSDQKVNENISKVPKSDSPDHRRPTTQGTPRTSSHPEFNESDVTDDTEKYQTVTESYMRSTVSSSVRGQTPEKQFRGSTPERTTHSRPRSPLKSEDPRRRPSEPEDVLGETATRRTSIRTETKQEVGGKFGVTLRKTPSSGKMVTKTIQRQNSRPADMDIESIFDLELLEEMLLKAVGYDDRRRIRAQIRLVKKQIEEEKNTTITTKVTKSTSSIQSTLPSVKDIKRQSSPSKSPDRQEHARGSPRPSPERREPSRRSPSASPERRQHGYSSPRASPERRERVHGSPRASPERYVKTSAPEKRSPDRTTTRRFSSEKTTTNGYTECRTITEKTTVRTQSVRKSTSSEVKETCPTDLITSSYGVGPTDENGKPLFGLRALRRTSTNKTLIDDNVEHETVTQEEEESRLFGLKALQTTEKMPAESSQLKELVERHQQYVRQSSAKDLQPVQKPKAKLRDSFILTQDENVTTVLQSGTEEIPKGLSLKSIIQKHENKNGSNVQSSMESKSTVVKSRSTVTSDGKVSLHRDVIHGEVSSKNNEEPVGKITRSSYSYQSPKDKDSLPNITSSTTTSLIGNRRSSGPKIEEITDSDSTFDSNRRYSKEYTVEESDTVGDRRSSAVSVEGSVKTYTSILKNSSESGRRSSGPRITDVSDLNSEQERRSSITKTISSRVSPDIAEIKSASSNRQQSFKNEENKTETQKKVITRGDSVKALQHKFQQATEAANQPSSRPYPRAGLILRSNTLQQIDDQTQMSSSMKHSSVERTSSKNKQEIKETKSNEVSSSPVLKSEIVTHQDSEVVRSVQNSRSEEPTSFLDNRTKVTGVQDILTRMRNADLVTEKTDSTEDAEARALLNKFLGASVILQGMEQGMRAAQRQSETEDTPTSPSSAALVIQAEKQRVKATAGKSVEDDIDEIHDEKQLRILLDACSDYEGRRKLRARLRTIMAEQKGGPEDVEESHGEFLGLRNIDDSGIESGEDLKGVNPEVMKEVEEALVRLECILPGLDVSRREAVSKLVNSLQSCLKLPPRRRITIGVSPGELAAARKWLKPPLEEMIIEHVNYCPVLQRPGYFMEPAPQQGILSYIPKTERSLSDSGSLQDYDPSLRLFTPEQTVQIAIHKAAIKKQISQEGKRRESSDDGDVSSGEESCEVNNYNEISSAQRLLQMASESAKKNPSAARFHNRSSKKLKMKRANTIDIPKPANFFEYSSGDEYGASADEVCIDVERKHHHNKEIKFLPPTFEPKTENDLKFLAFLKQVNENQPKVQTYNPSARGGKHWSNRFSSIKTAFEHTEQPKMSVPSPAKMFWQNSEAHQNNDYKDQYKNKLPWTVKTGDNGVVVGSLTVAKPGHVNNFNHAPKSAFKPIEKKAVSTVSGTVKQIAAQKFSVSDSETEKRPERNSKKQTNFSHSHMNYTPNTKQNTFINNTSSAFKKYNSSQSNNNEKPHSKVTTNPSSNSTYTSLKCFDTSNINDEKSINIQKYNINHNKTSSSNIQNSIKSYQYNTSSQPYTNNAFPSKTQQNTLAAKKQFMQISSNDTPQISGYKPTANITNDQGNNNHGFGRSFPTSFGYQPSICNSEFKNDYQKSSHNIPPKKNEYKISHQISNPSNNGYQTSSYSKNQEQSLLHSSNEGIVAPQNVSSKSISNNKNSSSSRYHFSSNVNSNTYADEDYKHSPTLHLEKNNFKIDTNDDFSIIGDDKQRSSKNDIYSSAAGYPTLPKNSDSYKQNNFLDPTHFKNKPYTAYIYSSNNTANSSDSFDQRPDISHISSDKPNHVMQPMNSSPLLIKEDPAPSSPYSLSVSSSLDRMSPQRTSSIQFLEDNRYLSPSYQSMSPSLRIEEDESPWGSVTNGDDSPLEEKAVSRVMGQAQCQQAVTVNNRTRRRFDLDLESELKLQVRQSAQKKSLSPSFPNVIQKSESWHQMVKEQMQQAKQAPPLPKISKAKSSHTLALPKQFEAALSQDTLTQKKITVSQYLTKQSKAAKSTKTNPKYKSTNTINIQQEDDDLADVDEVFESIFQESNKKRNKSSESSSEVVRKGDAVVKTEVHTRTTSSARLTKANSVQSPFAKFRQLERQNSAPSAGRPPPLFKFTEPKLAQSASTIKERLLSWVQAQTRHYKNIQIENFSTSWSNGLAFCALIHHFCPHAFDYDSLTPDKRRYNFELAFRVAEEEADIFPLLDVEDMVVMKKPDWKCVFTYVQSIYRRFHDSPDALPVF